jgi:hypothetical protein
MALEAEDPAEVHSWRARDLSLNADTRPQTANGRMVISSSHT